jgi:hypothetical protein
MSQGSFLRSVGLSVVPLFVASLTVDPHVSIRLAGSFSSPNEFLTCSSRCILIFPN